MEKSPILLEDNPCQTSWNGIGLGEGGAGRERGDDRIMASNQHFSTNTDLMQHVLLLVVHRSCCREHWGGWGKRDCQCGTGGYYMGAVLPYREVLLAAAGGGERERLGYCVFGSCLV